MDINDVIQIKERLRPGGRLLPLAKRLAKRHGQYKTGEYKKTIQNMQFNSGKVVRVNSSITTSINKRLQGYSYFRRVSGLAF
jgi:ribosomal protein L30E